MVGVVMETYRGAYVVVDLKSNLFIHTKLETNPLFVY